MKTHPFPKEFRLLKKTEFRKVYEEGQVVRSQAFVLFYIKGEEEKPSRLGITVTRSFGRAVRRNRIKRLIREAFRLLRPSMAMGLDMVINVRSGADKLGFREVFDQFSMLIKKADVNRVGDV
ncbi:MAG TPA: ribonuclease P protein component [Candidatus Sumerlaeia bacterium]|jgi:ribonuclease P protein component|nr:MAG: Ribonuclease P protein component [candidate division BRC1 bacterium ADurb.Bin183]HRR32343.1 ribonuclease P protein component [Candidatus Sumerlaeia bacterium]HRR99039.1 ribonuclease P protein component [Candidatus Sumerlaeia bacterium]